MNDIDFEEIGLPKNAKRVFEGVLFDVYQWEQEQFDGSFKTFEKVVKRGSTQIIVITKDKKIIVNKEKQPYRGEFVSLVGGMIDDRDENPEVEARRELLEECGMKCEKLELYTKKMLTNNIYWPTYYYIARDCVKVQEVQNTPSEIIENIELDFEEFIEFTQRDDFRNRMFRSMVFNMIHTPGEIEKFKKLVLGL